MIFVLSTLMSDSAVYV